MKKIKIDNIGEVPDNFTGIAKSYNGNKFWYRNGKLHREDGPAIERSGGYKEWFINGVRHRENGPAVEDTNGTKYWFRNGISHRLDGPAVAWSDGEKRWYKNGKLYRLDGPAVEFNNRKEYWIDDIRYSKEEFDRKTQLIRKQLSKRNTKYKHLTDDQWHDYLNIWVLE